MAQTTLKKLRYNGSDVYVEAANRDGSGNVITTTYATKGELTTAISAVQEALTAGTGIDITNSVISLKKATTDQLGGIKLGTGLLMDANGVVSVTAATSVPWSGVSDKPFISTNSTDFVITGNDVLGINTTNWGDKTFLANNYVSSSTFDTFRNTTLPGIYVAKEGFKASYLDTNNVIFKNSNISNLVNDSGYITKAVDDLTNYYKKSEVYNKTEIDSTIGEMYQLEPVAAAELPVASASTMRKLYFVPSSRTDTNDSKTEYITVRSGTVDNYTYAWERIGSTNMDLSPYVSTDNNIATGVIVVGSNNTKKVEGSSYTISNSSTEVSNTATTISTSAAIYAELAKKQNNLTQANNAGNGITISDGVIASVITATDVTLDY